MFSTDHRNKNKNICVSFDMYSRTFEVKGTYNFISKYMSI